MDGIWPVPLCQWRCKQRRIMAGSGKKKTHIDANMSYWQSFVLYIFKWMNYVLFALLYTRIQVYNLLANVLYTLL